MSDELAPAEVTHAATAAGRRRALLRTSLPGLVLTLGLGSLPYPVWDNELADSAHMLGNEAIYALLVAATIVHVRRVEGRTLQSIGLRTLGWRDALIAVVTAAATLAVLAAVYFLVLPALGVDEGTRIHRVLAAPGWWLLLSALRAGVAEEILFRGYPIERLQELTGSRWLAALLPLAIFALAHVPTWGWAHGIVALAGGAVFTAQYLWRRNLGANILAHVLVDGLAVLG